MDRIDSVMFTCMPDDGCDYDEELVQKVRERLVADIDEQIDEIFYSPVAITAQSRFYSDGRYSIKLVD